MPVTARCTMVLSSLFRCMSRGIGTVRRFVTCSCHPLCSAACTNASPAWGCRQPCLQTRGSTVSSHTWALLT